MKLKDAYLNMSLHKKLLIQFIVLSLLPILLIGAVSYGISYNVTHRNAIQFSKEIVHQTTERTDNLLIQARRLALMAAEDPAIQAALRNPLSNDIRKRYSQELELNTRLNFNSSYYDQLFSVYVLGANGGKYKSGYTTVKEADLTKTDWYQRIAAAEGLIWLNTDTGSLAAHTADESFISGGIAIKDKADGSLIGVVLVEIPEGQVAEVMRTKSPETGRVYMINAANKVVAQSDAAGSPALDSSNPILPDGTLIASKNLLVIEEMSGLTGWKTVGVIPIKELTKDSDKIGGVILGVLLLVCFFAIVFAWQMTRSVVKPIKEMSFLMKRVEAGDFQVTMPAGYRDEIGRLSRSFNLMIRKTDELMKRVLSDQEALRQAEIKSLQYQINPHFLYNTLDSIVWLARTRKMDDVVRMVMAITKLFRIGISRGKDIITIREELEHVNNYLIIQQMRYKKILAYTIDIPERLLDYRISKVILQPIVENAIYHGIKMKTEKGRITIASEEAADHLRLFVRDDGIGMTEEQLARLNNALMDRPGEKLNIYGIKNVDERIKLFFGPQYGLTYHSEHDGGTTVEIKIPKLQEENSHD